MQTKAITQQSIINQELSQRMKQSTTDQSPGKIPLSLTVILLHYYNQLTYRLNKRKIPTRGTVNLVNLINLKKYILNYLSDFGWKKNEKKLILVSVIETKTNYKKLKLLM